MKIRKLIAYSIIALLIVGFFVILTLAEGLLGLSIFTGLLVFIICMALFIDYLLRD